MQEKRRLFLKELLKLNYENFEGKKRWYLPYVLCDLLATEDNLVIGLCEHIKLLEAKKNVDSATKLTELVSTLVLSPTNNALDTINKIRDCNPNLDKKVWKWFIIPYRAKNKTTKLFDRICKLDAERVESQVSEIKSGCKVNVTKVDNKVYGYIDEEYRRKFMNLLDKRIQEQKHIVKQVSKRGLFTIIGHAFSASKRENYNANVKREQDELNALEKFKSDNSNADCSYIVAQIASIVKHNRNSDHMSMYCASSFFGITPIGKELVGFYDKMKQALDCSQPKASSEKASVTKGVLKKSVLVKNGMVNAKERKDKNIGNNASSVKKRIDQRNGMKKTEKFKNDTAKQQRETTFKSNDGQFLKFFQQENVNKQSGKLVNKPAEFYSNKIKKICFNQQPQFGAVEIKYKGHTYWMAQYIDPKLHSKYKNDTDNFLQKIAACYQSTQGVCLGGVEFNEDKFKEIFSSKKNSHSFKC